jgi:PAS domain-containing protein
MTEASTGSDHVPRHVGAAAEAVFGARGDARKLERIFEHSRVPIVMVDASRRYVEVNRSARLWFRLGLEAMRRFAIDDLTTAPRDAMEEAWARLLDVGCAAGRSPAYGSDGSHLELVYRGLAHIRPGLHVIAFAPADWPEHDFEPIEEDRPHASGSLTPREIEVLALAADGLSGPQLAQGSS